MRIYFKTTKLQKQCSVDKEMRKSFGQKICAIHEYTNQKKAQT